MSEYLSKEEIKKWRSSVEKITLEEYAARLGKKLQEEKKTNDLADMLYTHYNPADSSKYNAVTKLEKIDLTPKMSVKPKKTIKEDILDNDDFEVDEDDISFELQEAKKPKKVVEESKVIKQKEAKSSTKEVVKEETTKKPKVTTKEETSPKSTNKETEKVAKEKPTKTKKEKTAAKKEPKAKIKSEEKSLDISSLNITFNKPLTDREEKVLSYFIEKKGEIVFAKDLAELLNLKRDYIYKYIKNLRAKMSTDIIVNADNGGFKLD